MDAHLDRRKRPAERLVKLMRPLHRNYANLFFDCAPGLSLVSENVLHAADALVIPLLPTPLSVRTLEQLLEFVARQNWRDIVLLPFFSMVDRRRRLHRDTTASLRERFPMLLATEVPYGAAFEMMAMRRAPIASFAPSSVEAGIYQKLWEEIDVRIASQRGAGSQGKG
jgi:chromosome partitioning protein